MTPQPTNIEVKLGCDKKKFQNTDAYLNTHDEKLWVLLVLGPSAGLALSEASFLGGIRSFCMSRSKKGQIVMVIGYNRTVYL